MHLIEQYKREEERAVDYLNKTKKMILQVMDKQGVKNVQAGGLTITKVDGYFRTTIDTKALKEAEPRNSREIHEVG
jgi:hypothetical protein